MSNLGNHIHPRVHEGDSRFIKQPSYSQCSLSGIAWLIIPQKWTINTGSGAMEINSWRVFLAICSLPEFLACLALFAFPESPRFLLLKGRREEALEVFKKIYSVNTGKNPDTYPVRNLLSHRERNPPSQCVRLKATFTSR